jgi:hypothetical protein
MERAMTRPIIAAATLIVWLIPAFALDQPVIWRDPDTGCGYFLTPQGGMTIRFRADGSIDCPNASREASSGRGILEDMAKELGRGLDALRRELERLRQPSAERI